MPNVTDPLYILAQMPLSTDKEKDEFWQVLFHKQVDLVFLPATPHQSGIFFPMAVGECHTLESIGVTNKVVDKQKRATIYRFELILTGCSNAKYVSLVHCEQWAPLDIPPLKTILSLMRMNRGYPAGSGILIEEDRIQEVRFVWFKKIREFLLITSIFILFEMDV